MSKVLHETGFGSLPSSTEINPRDQVKSISTSIKVDSNSIRHIGSNKYAVSTRPNSTPLYKARQTTVPFPSCLDNHYCEEEGNYGPKFTEAYGASHINTTIPRKEKDPGKRVGSGGRGRRPREGNDERVDELNGQGNDQGMRANRGVEGVNGNVERANGGAPDFSMIIAQQLQNLLPAMLAQV
ncbi:hypothetical protein Tco_1553296, partial [Tanacetum coccineum]